MLTQYDEFPVHQYAYPFSELPSNDLNWDDGYFFGVYNAEAKLFLYTGMRVTPNANMIGAYAGVSLAGRQLTVRSSRTWRQNVDTSVGPIRYEFTKPFREIRLVCEQNASPVSFDLRWLATAPAHEEAHHYAKNGGRVTTDQTRYAQAGTAEGWIEVEGERYEVTPFEWYADRDHSWGLYEPRSPLSDPKEWLPPAESAGGQRMLRFWMPFSAREYSGFFHFHEDEHGGQVGLNDAFGTPFEGALDFGWDAEKPRLHFVKGEHELTFLPGTRVIEGGTIRLEDEHGRDWRVTLEHVCMPWTTFPIGYYQGTWNDGGNIHTYHGPDDPYVEWDEVDFSSQPAKYTLRGEKGRTFDKVYGAEYVFKCRTEGPEGTSEGLSHVEFFMHRRYSRYQPQDG